MADHASLRDSLRNVREQLSEEREPKLFDVPGYGSKLQAKYRVLKPSEEADLDKQRFKMLRAEDDDAPEWFKCATLARACVGLYSEVDSKVVPLNEAEDLGEDMIHWGDERLAKFFGIELDGPVTARTMIEEIVGAGPEGDKRVREHFLTVAGWLDQGQEAADEDF
jgi:hypothetical protein